MVGVQRDVDRVLLGDDVANSASATAPVTMSFTLVPEANSAPPVENWMIPSLPASANPRSAALTVSDDVQLIAG